MAKAIRRLSAEMVESAGPGKHADGGNLYLMVGKNNRRSWVLIYRFDGKQREAGLGKAGKDGVSLADARRQARDGRKMLDGRPSVDPLTVWKPTPMPTTQTFGEAAANYITLKAPGWSGEHTRQWRSSLARHCGSINNLPIDKIDTAAVRAVLEPIWNVVPETASRVRARIETVINYAKADDETRPNPARWRGHIADKGFSQPKELGKLPRRKDATELIPRDNFAALPHVAAPAFARRLRAEDSVAARALEFLFLCTSRTSEVRLAQWSEIDVDAATWTVPAARLKVGKRTRMPHIVPLVGRGIAIIEEMSAVHCGPYLFPGRFADAPLNDSALLDVVKKLEPGATTHGLRSCFADYIAEKTSFSSELVEHQLGHVLGGVRGKYRRETGVDQRRTMLGLWDAYLAGAPLDRWAAYLVKPTIDEDVDNILPFAARAS